VFHAVAGSLVISGAIMMIISVFKTDSYVDAISLADCDERCGDEINNHYNSRFYDLVTDKFTAEKKQAFGDSKNNERYEYCHTTCRKYIDQHILTDQRNEIGFPVKLAAGVRLFDFTSMCFRRLYELSR
jgi:hypothetical protein